MLDHEYYSAGPLVSILLVYMIVSAIVGLWILHKENQLYATLWNGHWTIRALTILSHCLGLGLLPLSVDMAMERYKEMFRKKKDEDSKQRLVKKTKHFVSMALLQIFLGKLNAKLSIAR